MGNRWAGPGARDVGHGLCRATSVAAGPKKYRHAIKIDMKLPEASMAYKAGVTRQKAFSEGEDKQLFCISLCVCELSSFDHSHLVKIAPMLS